MALSCKLLCLCTQVLAIVCAAIWLQGCGGEEETGGLPKYDDPCDMNGANSTSEPDHALFTKLLQEYVKPGEKEGVTTTLVNYTGLRSDSRLEEYMRQFCNLDLESFSVAQRLSTLINAYNAMMLTIIVHYDPKTSVRELSDRVPEESIWKHKFGTLARQKVSLDDIEHTMIRGGLSKEFGAQGRIHASVVCASVSCPDLQLEAFEADRLDAQLDAATQSWLANPTKNPGPTDTGKLSLTMIFKWYKDDFVADSGSVQAFVRRLGPSSWATFEDGAAVEFIEYNWGLNAAV